MKLNIELYLKVDFLWTGGGFIKGPITGTGKEIHNAYSRLLVICRFCLQVDRSVCVSYVLECSDFTDKFTNVRNGDLRSQQTL